MNINLLKYESKIKIKKEEGIKKIWDPVRKKTLLLTPEELVRQLFIQYLTSGLGFPLSLISVERQIKVFDTSKRFDIVVYLRDMTPIILVECKSFSQRLSQQTTDQVGWYNATIKAKYIVTTNGQNTEIFEIDHLSKSSRKIPELPRFNSL